MSRTSARALLGNPDEGQVILLVGPKRDKLLSMAKDAGIETRDVKPFQISDVRTLQAGVLLSGASLALIGSVAEVEGILDRSAFGRGLTDLAYGVDRVVYVGEGVGVVVWPETDGLTMSLRGGQVRALQRLDVVSEGEPVGVAGDDL